MQLLAAGLHNTKNIQINKHVINYKAIQSNAFSTCIYHSLFHYGHLSVIDYA